jgi:hypothetical protein
MDYGEEANGDADQQAENLYSNNHDLIGVEGIVRAQKNEIEKKKVNIYTQCIMIYSLNSG